MSRRTRSAATALGLIALSVVVGQAVGLASGDHNTIPASVIAEAAIQGVLAAVFAVGVVLVYRAGRIINFAHGSFGVLAATLFLLLTAVWGWSWWLAFPASLAAAGAAGVVVETLFVRRFVRAPRLVLTVVTIAVAQVIGGLVGLLPGLFGLESDSPLPSAAARSPVSRFTFSWFPIVFRGDHLLAVAVAAAVLGAMAGFFRFTNIGIGIRGAAENDDRAAMLGVNTSALSSLVWGLAAALSGIAAVMLLPLQGATLATVSSGIAAGSLLRALAAAVLGRMENLPLTAAAAVSIAIFERSVFWATSQTAIVDAALLGVIVVALLTQRRSLARAEESMTGTWSATEEARAIPSELRNVDSVRRGVRGMGVVVAVVVLGLPWVMSPSQTNVAELYAIYGIVAVSLVVLTGWGGQISLGQFAFVAVGAVVGGAMTSKWGWPFPIALLAASLVGAAVAVLLGLPALRIKGLFLAVTTMAFAVAVRTVLLNPRFFGWLLPGRIERPKLLFLDTEDERVYYYLCVLALAGAVTAAKALRNSRTGRVLIAMRDNERTAQSFAINLVRTRLATFAISGFLAAFAGVLFAHQQHAVSQTDFAPEQSIQMFLMAVIGGLGSVSGVLLGALYLGTANLLVKGTAGQLLTSGAGVLIVLLLQPGGLGSVAFAARDAWLRRIAIRDRIFVPSLVGDYRVLDGEHTRAPLAPKPPVESGNGHTPPDYRLPSRIGVAGTSQAGRGWRY